MLLLLLALRLLNGVCIALLLAKASIRFRLVLVVLIHTYIMDTNASRFIVDLIALIISNVWTSGNVDLSIVIRLLTMDEES